MDILKAFVLDGKEHNINEYEKKIKQRKKWTKRNKQI